MRLQLPLAALLAAGCQGSDHDIEVAFRVTDTTGAPRPEARVSCAGEGEGDGVSYAIEGWIRDLGDGRQLCTVEDADAWPVVISARIGTAVVDAYAARQGVDQTNPVVIWDPLVSAERVDDQIVVSWDPAPLVPGAEPDGDIELYVEPWIGFARRPLDATSATFSVDEFEDFANPSVRFDIQQTTGGVRQYQDPGRIALPQQSIVPASRGAACTVTTNGETVAYAAGECPLTDGVTTSLGCCDQRSAVVDLGAELSIRRIRVRGSGGMLARSPDGVSWLSLDEIDEAGNDLSPPVTGRFIRVTDVAQLGEISVFTP